jgi:hypothetical protein
MYTDERALLWLAVLTTVSGILAVLMAFLVG